MASPQPEGKEWREHVRCTFHIDVLHEINQPAENILLIIRVLYK